MITRTEIRQILPHGAGKKIAQKAGVTQRFVSKYFNNSNVNSERVELATVEVLEEINKKNIALERRLMAAMA